MYHCPYANINILSSVLKYILNRVQLVSFSKLTSRSCKASRSCFPTDCKPHWLLCHFYTRIPTQQITLTALRAGTIDSSKPIASDC